MPRQSWILQQTSMTRRLLRKSMSPRAMLYLITWRRTRQEQRQVWHMSIWMQPMSRSLGAGWHLWLWRAWRRRSRRLTRNMLWFTCPMWWNPWMTRRVIIIRSTNTTMSPITGVRRRWSCLLSTGIRKAFLTVVTLARTKTASAWAWQMSQQNMWHLRTMGF